MRLLVLFSLLGLALALPTKNISWQDVIEYEVLGYHENVGVKRAAQIKAAEEAVDFDGASRIVGGSAASLGQYPHMGGLVIDLVNGRVSTCGSSLLSNTRLITAARCWSDRDSQAWRFTVVLGSVTLFSGGYRIPTTNVRVHDDWNPSSIWALYSDIAIITVPRVTYSEIVGPIALPSGTLLENDYVGVWAQAAGFGDQSHNSNTGTLHHVTMQVIDNTVCQEVYGGAVIGSIICTSGDGGRSTCTGDTGGPLQYFTGTGNVLIGVTSFGHSLGCELNYPAAHTRVTHFARWIQNQL